MARGDRRVRGIHRWPTMLLRGAAAIAAGGIGLLVMPSSGAQTASTDLIGTAIADGVRVSVNIPGFLVVETV